jgi:hypothetical protein
MKISNETTSYSAWIGFLCIVTYWVECIEHIKCLKAYSIYFVKCKILPCPWDQYNLKKPFTDEDF